MLEIMNEKLFRATVSNAIEAAAANSGTEAQAKRWINAIEKAVSEIETNPFISWDAKKHSLLIMSELSNNIYAANGVCQCEAFRQNQPCYHRAAARIWRLYLEALAEESTPKLAPLEGVYQKRVLNAAPVEYVCGIRI